MKFPIDNGLLEVVAVETYCCCNPRIDDGVGCGNSWIGFLGQALGGYLCSSGVFVYKLFWVGPTGFVLS